MRSVGESDIHHPYYLSKSGQSLKTSLITLLYLEHFYQ